MNRQPPSLTFYLGHGTESQTRVVARQFPKSPRTWIAHFGTSGDRWRSLSVDNWEDRVSPTMTHFLSPRMIFPKSFAEPWLDAWACDHLLLDDLPVRGVMHPGALKGFGSLAIRRSMNIHLALIVGDDSERQAFEDFLIRLVKPCDVIRFWIPTQNHDLRYLRLPAASWIEPPQAALVDAGLSDLLCLLRERPREIGHHP